MIVVVRQLSGVKLNFDVDGNDTILHLKELIEEKLNHPVENQKLLFRGLSLSNESTFSQIGISDHGVLHLVTNVLKELFLLESNRLSRIIKSK